MTSSATSGVLGSDTAPAFGDGVAPPLFAAYTTVNVKQHVPISLSLGRPNFSKWKAFFIVLCGKYRLLGHINGIVVACPADPSWSQPDACVHGWMYDSVDDVVLDLAMEPAQDTRALYVSIEALFQENKESRAIILEQEFHNLSQSNLSVDAYAQQLKRTADTLQEVGHTVSPAQLILNLLRGLNTRSATTADIIANTTPLHEFMFATNMLRVKELRLGTEQTAASTSALVVSIASSCTSSSCHSTSSTTNSGGGGKGKGAKARVVAVVMVAAAARTTTVVVTTSSRVADARLPRPPVLGSATLGSAHGLHQAANGLRSSNNGHHRHRPHSRHTPLSRHHSSPPPAPLRVAGTLPA
jgi:hypothetical protein